MIGEDAYVEVEFKIGTKKSKLKALVDTGSYENIISRELAKKLSEIGCLRCFVLPEKYWMSLKVGKKGESIRLIGACAPDYMKIEGMEKEPHIFWISPDVPEDTLVIGHPGIDKWMIEVRDGKVKVKPGKMHPHYGFF